MVPMLRLNGSSIPPDQRPSFYGIIMRKYVLALLFILPVSATLSSVFNSENIVYADSVQSYTYHFDSTNVTSSFNPSQTYLYNSGDLVNYQNPFQFTPKYVGFNYTYSSNFSPSFYQQFCSAGIHNGSTNTNLFCFGPYNSDSGLVSLINTGTFYISAGNFANINAGSNPFSLISGGIVELDITFYSDNPSTPPTPEPCPTCPDCDDNLIAQLFKSTFWNVATSLVALIVPILALFLIFRLVHDFFWGKG